MMSESTPPTAHASAPGAATEREQASVSSPAAHAAVAAVSTMAATALPRPESQNSSQGVSEPASPTSGSDQATAAGAPDGSSTGASGAANSTNRKRVFTFQKRWLHSLPIMEKVLSDSALDAASVAALKAANLLGEDGKPVDDAAARDVIVCMLCDDPNSTRDMLKIWSRVNCRRGRIENHLMSKHPEFMLLLKQKRETDGDLAVQIFLQDMREGRCNVRNEISAGLYSHMQPMGIGAGGGASDGAHTHKRAFGQDDFMMPASATAAAAVAAMAITNTPYQVRLLEVVGSQKDGDDENNRRKRAKAQGATARDSSDVSAPAVVSQSHEEAEQQCEATLRSSLLHASLLSYHGPAAFTQWRSILTNKMIVITGGENAVVARAATNLWLLGANILITFAELNTMEGFATSYLAQFHAMEGVEPPRGVMLPLFCSLQTRPQIEEWSRSIAAKFEHVDLLINYVDQASDAIIADQDPTKRPTDEPLATSKSRSRAICEVFSATCMQRTRRAAIINMSTQANNGVSSVVEAMTTVLANELHASNVQVNCLVVEPPTAESSAQFSADQDLSLLHSILFLLSPASNAISGSVLRQRRSHADSVIHRQPLVGSGAPAAAPVPSTTTAASATATAGGLHSQTQADTGNDSGSASGTLAHEVI